MTRFSASNQSAATIHAPRKEIWAALTDPELLPRLTPYLQRIEVAGDRWTWHLSKIPLMGASIGSTFTEVMTFEEPSLIRYEHDPARSEEKTSVSGEYRLEEVPGGTHVSIRLSVEAELPFPRAMRRPVEGAMGVVMGGMGKVFGRNLLKHLGAS
ncbi:MAG: SRPBCC family protein [Nocardioides sp.]|uniref:SRPBCC family protein n=1 Tax=Nocardioides sp. TaxID=35761 RepID=UPI0039E62BD1